MKTTTKSAAKAAQAARKAAALARQAAIKAAQAAKMAAQIVIKAAAALIKALVAAIQALVAAIAAGGWVAVLIIVLVVIIVVLVLSPIGVFFSGDVQENRKMPDIIAETRAAFMAEIDRIKATHTADVVVLDYEGDSLIGNWRDVIAIFAVKTTTDPENGLAAIHLDDENIERFQAVFWDMNEIHYRLETEEVVTQTENDDGTTETEVTTITKLLISVSSMDAEEAAHFYNFSLEQLDLLAIMLSSEFRAYYAELIGHPDDGAVSLTQEQREVITHNLPAGQLGSAIVKKAFEKLGDPYDYGHGAGGGIGKKADCSAFTKWVYAQVGVTIPRTAAEQARYCADNNLTIAYSDLVPGDLIFFSHDTNGRYLDITHVAIYCGDGMVIDSSSSRGEVVYRRLYSGQVLYGRPHITQ